MNPEKIELEMKRMTKLGVMIHRSANLAQELGFIGMPTTEKFDDMVKKMVYLKKLVDKMEEVKKCLDDPNKSKTYDGKIIKDLEKDYMQWRAQNEKTTPMPEEKPKVNKYCPFERERLEKEKAELLERKAQLPRMLKVCAKIVADIQAEKMAFEARAFEKLEKECGRSNGKNPK